MTDGWKKFLGRGEVMERFDREHLQQLTLEEAIRDLEDLLRGSEGFPEPDASTWPLPVSLSRLFHRRTDGAR